MYYKIIKDNLIIDVSDSSLLIRYQKQNDVFISTNDIKIACSIIGLDGNTQYHSPDMLKYPYYDNTIIEVKLEEIDKNEYDTLLNILKENKTYIPEDIPIPSDDDLDNSLNFLKEKKIKDMSDKCNSIILSGVDVRLSDNKIYHFDLSVEDQLNLLTLEKMINQGIKEIPYHASGEECRLYSDTDMIIILNAATNFKIFHVTYFNSLKSYIKSLNNIIDISNIKYGMDIPIQYQTDILKSLLKNKSLKEVDTNV